jgi:subtilisin family serine protease
VKTADLTLGGVIPDPYANVSGASFAAPHVAGAMALLRQAVPGASVLELETALMETAWDLGASGPDNTYGYGLVDVIAAYRFLVGCNADCSGDLDRDRDVDGRDLAAWASGDGGGTTVDLTSFADDFARTDCNICE